MTKLEESQIVPCGKNVLVSIEIIEKEINGVKMGKQLATKMKTEFYIGTVLALGENANERRLYG